MKIKKYTIPPEVPGRYFYIMDFNILNKTKNNFQKFKMGHVPKIDFENGGILPKNYQKWEFYQLIPGN